MARLVFVVVLACASGCGRIDFDALASADAASDSATSSDGGDGGDSASLDGGDAEPGDGGPLDADGSAVTANRAFFLAADIPGDFGGRADADGLCSTEATAAGLDGEFIALLWTDDATPSDPLAGSRGWVDVAGLPLVDTPSQWTDTTMFHPLRRDARGAALDLEFAWFGGTSALQRCGNWASSTMAGSTANTGGATGPLGTTTACTARLGLFCAERGRNTMLAPTRDPTGRVAFVTAGNWSPGAGRADADAFCADEARIAGLSGSFLALLLTSTEGHFDRFDTGGPTWVRTDGIPLAPTAADVAGPLPDWLDTFITLTADGGVRDSFDPWTGSAGAHCNDWTSNLATDMGTLGDHTSAFRARMLDVFDATCDIAHPLYCFEE